LISSRITAASLFTPSSITALFENEKLMRSVFCPELLQKNVEPETNATFFSMAFAKIDSESMPEGRVTNRNNPPYG
jgi:hypothetical protein